MSCPSWSGSLGQETDKQMCYVWHQMECHLSTAGSKQLTKFRNLELMWLTTRKEQEHMNICAAAGCLCNTAHTCILVFSSSVSSSAHFPALHFSILYVQHEVYLRLLYVTFAFFFQHWSIFFWPFLTSLGLFTPTLSFPMPTIPSKCLSVMINMVLHLQIYFKRE